MGHYRNGFRAVHHASATQRHEEVATVLAGNLRSGIHIAHGRIRHHAVEQESLHACFVQLFLRAGKITVGTGRFAVGDDNEGAFARHRLFTQFVQHPCPEHHTGGDVHVVSKICFHCSFYVYDSVAKVTRNRQNVRNDNSEECTRFTESGTSPLQTRQHGIFQIVEKPMYLARLAGVEHLRTGKVERCDLFDILC